MTVSKALAAARSGMTSLAAYQKANPGVTLNFEGVNFQAPENVHIDFSGFEFHSTANFREAIFGDTLITSNGLTGPLFSNCIFHQHAIFADACFGNGARFDRTIFKDNAVFGGAIFGESANFSGSVITDGSFGHSTFGRRANFCSALFVKSCSFEESIFNTNANFNGTIFERAHFQSSLFADDANFELAIFAALAQFNNMEFGAGACFRGTSFCTSANFQNTTFADHASFEGVGRGELINFTEANIKLLPPEYAAIVSERVQQSAPSSFERANFAGALFSSVQHQYSNSWSTATGVKNIVLEGVKEIARRCRILFYSDDGIKGPGETGASFAGRTIKKFADFSRVNFLQPPNFDGVEPATAIDFSKTHFSFRATSWPYFHYWTTRTSTLTQLRRLRKVVKDIEESDIERNLFVLQRLAERGVAWKVWWESVLRGWGIYDLISSRLKAGQAGVEQYRKRNFQKLVRSCLVLFKGIGHPLILTILAFLYRYTSNFGRSITLPFVWFVGGVGVFAHKYSQYTTSKHQDFWDIDLLIFSLSHSLPVSSLAKGSLNELTIRLFPNGLHPEVLAITMSQTLIQTFLLFLIGLALRNHFRLR